MRRVNKYRVLIILPFVILLAFFLYLQFSWLYIFEYREMKQNASMVSSNSRIPENFLKIWDKVYPDSRTFSMNEQLLGQLFSDKVKNCKCDEIGYLAWDNYNLNFKFDLNRGLGKYRDFGFGLEHFISPKDCFNFWLNNDINWNGKYLKNLDELSKLVFDEKVSALSDDQILRLIAFRQLGQNASSDSNRFAKSLSILRTKFRNN